MQKKLEIVNRHLLGEKVEALAEELMLELRTSKKYGYRRIKWHFKRRLGKYFCPIFDICL